MGLTPVAPNARLLCGGVPRVERRMRPEICMTHTKTLVAVSISKVSLAQPRRIWQWGHNWRFQPALVLSLGVLAAPWAASITVLSVAVECI